MPFIFLAAVHQQLLQFYLTSTSSFSNPLLLRTSFKADILNLTLEHLWLKIHLSARWAAWAQKTSVPSSDKPGGVRDWVKNPGCWRGCRIFMEAPWIPQKSPSLMKDSLSMTVLGPLVIDLRGLRTTLTAPLLWEFWLTSDHLPSWQWAMQQRFSSLFCFPSPPLGFFGQVTVVAHYLRPGWVMATATFLKSWLNLHLP